MFLFYFKIGDKYFVNEIDGEFNPNFATNGNYAYWPGAFRTEISKEEYEAGVKEGNKQIASELDKVRFETLVNAAKSLGYAKKIEDYKEPENEAEALDLMHEFKERQASRLNDYYLIKEAPVVPKLMSEEDRKANQAKLDELNLKYTKELLDNAMKLKD